MVIESISFLIMFIFPGLFIRLIRSNLKPERKTQLHTYEYLLNVILDSMVIFLIMLLILRLRLIDISTLSILTKHLDSTSFIIKYFIVSLLLCFGWYPIRYKLIEPLLRRGINQITKTNKIELSTSSVWEKFIYSEEFLSGWSTVSIYKDDTYVTTGMVEWVSTPNEEQCEFMLTRVAALKELREKYPKAFETEQAFYSANNSLMVLLHYDDKIKEHWAKCFPDK